MGQGRAARLLRRARQGPPSGADGIFVFYPGPAGPAFIKQYEQAGLVDVLPLYTVFTVDSISLPRLQKAGLKGVPARR